MKLFFIFNYRKYKVWKANKIFSFKFLDFHAHLPKGKILNLSINSIESIAINNGFWRQTDLIKSPLRRVFSLSSFSNELEQVRRIEHLTGIDNWIIYAKTMLKQLMNVRWIRHDTKCHICVCVYVFMCKLNNDEKYLLRRFKVIFTHHTHTHVRSSTLLNK